MKLLPNLVQQLVPQGWAWPTLQPISNPTHHPELHFHLLFVLSPSRPPSKAPSMITQKPNTREEDKWDPNKTRKITEIVANLTIPHSMQNTIQLKGTN